MVWVSVPFYADKPKYTPDGTMVPRKMRTDRVKYHIVWTQAKEPQSSADDLSAKYPEAYELGRQLGYPDSEIAEALAQEGPEVTLNFLRAEKQKRQGKASR